MKENNSNIFKNTSKLILYIIIRNGINLQKKILSNNYKLFDTILHWIVMSLGQNLSYKPS